MDKREKKKILIIAGYSVLGILVLATTIYGITRIPPDFEKLSDEKVLEYARSGKPGNLNSEQLANLGERLEKVPSEKRREAVRTLTEDERENFRGNGRLIADAVLNRTIDEFFSLPDEKQDAFLDKQIQQMAERRQEFAQRFRAPAEGGGTAPNFPMGGMQREERSRTPEGAGAVMDGGARGEMLTGGRDPGRRAMTPEARLQRSRNRLSAVSPEHRAKRREYFRRLMERRRAARSRG